MIVKQLRVYHPWDEHILKDIYREWVDGGYLNMVGYDRQSKTYEVAFNYVENWRGFSRLFYDNVKSSDAKLYRQAWPHNPFNR